MALGPRRIALGVYLVALFTATHWPQLRIDIGELPRPDLLLHFSAFSIFTVLIAGARLFGPTLAWRSIGLSALAAAVYGVFDELTQATPGLGRFATIDDYLANLGGIVIGAVLLAMLAPFVHLARDFVHEHADEEPAPPPPPAGDAEDDARAAGRGVRAVSGLTLVSRVFGLVRDLVTVRIFGDTLAGSAFAAALAVPNLFRRLFAEGALGAAFVPEYARLAASDDRDNAAGALASITVAAVALITGLITVFAEVLLLVLLLAIPGNEARTLSLGLIMAALPYMPLICSAALLGAVLQCHGRFAPWAASPIILNICILGVGIPALVIGAAAGSAAYWIMGAIGCAGVLQILWSLVALRGRVRWTAGWKAARPAAARVMVRVVPAMLGLGTLQFSSLLDTLVAMYPNFVGSKLPAFVPFVGGVDYPLDEASNAILFYAQRLYQFPLGVFGIAVATVAFPELSRRASDAAGFAGALSRAIRLSLFIGLPASAGLIVVAEPLVRTLFTGAGGFTDDGAHRAALVLSGYAAAVWAYSVNHVLTRAFYALGDTKTPLRAAVLMVGLNLGLNLMLIWPMREAGLALGTAVAAVAQMLLLGWWLRARLAGGRVVDAEAGRSVAFSAATAMAMAALVAVPAVWFLRPRDAWADHAIMLAVCVALGGGSYLGLAAVRQAKELSWLISRNTRAERRGGTDGSGGSSG